MSSSRDPRLRGDDTKAWKDIGLRGDDIKTGKDTCLRGDDDRAWKDTRWRGDDTGTWKNTRLGRYRYLTPVLIAAAYQFGVVVRLYLVKSACPAMPNCF